MTAMVRRRDLNAQETEQLLGSNVLQVLSFS